MKIRVNYEASETQRRDVLDFEDLGITEQEWNEMDKEAKVLILMTDAEKETPYWVVDNFEVIE